MIIVFIDEINYYKIKDEGLRETAKKVI
jgi:hypothetical protein